MVKKISMQCRRPRFNPWVGKVSWRREWLPTPVFLPGKFHGQRSLAGYKSMDHEESYTIYNTNIILYTCFLFI